MVLPLLLLIFPLVVKNIKSPNAALLSIAYYSQSWLGIPTDVLAVAKVEYLNYLKLTEKPCPEIGAAIIADNKMPEYL